MSKQLICDGKCTSDFNKIKKGEHYFKFQKFDKDGEFEDLQREFHKGCIPDIQSLLKGLKIGESIEFTLY